jgi:hypothetical protein
MTHKTKAYYLSNLGIIFFLTCTTLLTSCSVPQKRLEKDRLTLRYLQKSEFTLTSNKLRMQHPIKISNAQVVNHLLSMSYEELSLLGNKKYIFSSNDVLEIAPLITKRLNRMKASKVLYYEVENPKGKTAGTIFQNKGKINWVFETIKGINFLNSNKPRNRGSTWVLLPNNGQEYSKEHSILGNNQQQNWIVSKLNLATKSRRVLKSRLQKKTPKKRSIASHDRKELKHINSNQVQLKKKLKFLKDLHNKKLIDDNEYAQKKKELLK